MTSKKPYLVIGIIFIILVMAIVFSLQQQETSQSPSASLVKNFETQSSNEGGVTIEITPQSISDGVFAVSLNTHSVNLSDDLMQVTNLNDESGKKYLPISWKGDPPGGHHREGILNFGPISPTPKKIEIVIRGIGGVSERRFLWIIQS